MDNLCYLYTSSDVDDVIRNLAGTIFYKSTSNKIVLIGILKGGLFTTFRLLHALNSYSNSYSERFGHYVEIEYGFIGFSSYKNEMVSKNIQLTYPLDLKKEDLKGKDVWIVDDILDTGKTIRAAIGCVEDAGGINSLNAVTLVKRKQEINVCDFGTENKKVGIKIHYGILYEGSEFLVGCGMGLGEKYRCLPSLCKVVDSCLKE